MTDYNKASSLGVTEHLSALPSALRCELARRLEEISVRRGEVLVHEGRSANSFYLVLVGRFLVTQSGNRHPVAEISSGQPIGEIAFLTNASRTATVTALRDSIVLRLTRDVFDDLCDAYPELWESLAQSLASRLHSTMTQDLRRPPLMVRTIAVVPAGRGTIPREFVEVFSDRLRRKGRIQVVRSSTVEALVGRIDDIQSSDFSSRLHELELLHDKIVFVADGEQTEWSERVVRQADIVLSVAYFEAVAEPNALERLAYSLLSPERRRLVLVHKRKASVEGTALWLAGRTVEMHHHVALDTLETFDRLIRFLNGSATGLVACGGGAFCAAHVGAYKAFLERNICFDYLGGTSAGSAMMGAFALGVEPDVVNGFIERIFVTNKAMQSYTWPRYGLLDHQKFDRQLMESFRHCAIEDLWIPFFSVSTNLSRHELMVHTTGSMFFAIRASSSIPVLLPPVYTPSGEMLVDGCLLNNVPIGPMNQLKSGPNFVISFESPASEMFDVNYSALPSGPALIAQSVNPFTRAHLPSAPGVIDVLTRSLMANRNDFKDFLQEDDILLTPPLPTDVSFLDWNKHEEISEKAYHWTGHKLTQLEEDDCSLLSRFRF